MSGRTLLLDTFAGKPTDRIPVAPMIVENLVNEANGGIPPEDPIAACAELYRKYGLDMLLRIATINGYVDEKQHSCGAWQVETTLSGTLDVAWSEKTVITTPERQLTQIRDYRRITPNYVVNARSEDFIKTKDDFEQFKKYQPPVGVIDCRPITHVRSVVGDDGVACSWIYGAFNMAEQYRGLSNLLVDPFDDEDFYNEMMAYFQDRLFQALRQIIAAGADILCMDANMATGTMAGPAFFKEYVMPYENQVIDAIHKADCFCMYHNCGDAKSLLPLYDAMEMDVYESLTPPPYGDTILREALETIKSPKVLCGNVDQMDFLVHATPDQVRQRVREVLEEVKPRGHFILSCSDYLSEGTPPENILAMSEAAREYGQYA